VRKHIVQNTTEYRAQIRWLRKGAGGAPRDLQRAEQGNSPGPWGSEPQRGDVGACTSHTPESPRLLLHLPAVAAVTFKLFDLRRASLPAMDSEFIL
jgi:hypothetical protein